MINSLHDNSIPALWLSSGAASADRDHTGCGTAQAHTDSDNQAAAQYGIKPTAPVQPKHIASVYPVSPQDRKPAVTQPVEQPKHVDVSKIEVGTAVKHKAFGNGVIINKDKAGKFVTVKFYAGEKKFVLQDAFDRGFLSL